MKRGNINVEDRLGFYMVVAPPNARSAAERLSPRVSGPPLASRHGVRTGPRLAPRTADVTTVRQLYELSSVGGVAPGRGCVGGRNVEWRALENET